jgi:hypothetical protein
VDDRPVDRSIHVFYGGGVTSRLAIVAAAIALLGVSSTACANGASNKIYVERDIVNQELAVRPHMIGLAADGTLAMTGIRWLSYGGPVAKAKARAYVRGCTPDCAQGHVFRPRTTLRFTNVTRCRGVRIHARIHWVPRGSLPERRRRRGTESLRPTGGEHGC